MKETFFEKNWGWLFWVILAVLGIIIGSLGLNVNLLFLSIPFILIVAHFIFEDIKRQREQEFEELIAKEKQREWENREFIRKERQRSKFRK